ncbi:DUF4199 domain-containing protein [Aquimarina sp. BL5]|uniref:DUF4199 domain-containing protein n=1 Tax=Aquimarina sp. BL5 TaxID=1714860 RepID=UPI000E536A6B|nr:DUF4199 domain-containing protein [Aquimarina sp. BL5]AXT50506.1 DUF4199 domain-containing protein [Aquimarina sp. BL5]RKN02696.1 DUF4199 family protein [Aquimarina sp. BL5]
MEKPVKSNGIAQGITLGVILSLITVIAYAVYQDFFTKLWYINLAIAILLPITLGIIAAVKSRKQLEGFISFKSAFTSYFITVVIGTLISSVVAILIFNVVDPEAALDIKEKGIQVSVDFMESMGAPQEEIEKQIAKAEEQDTLSLGSQVKGWFGWMIFYIIIGLLACLAVKKKEPLY